MKPERLLLNREWNETVSNDILLRDVKFWYCGKCYCEKVSTKVDLKLMIKNGKLIIDNVK